MLDKLSYTELESLINMCDRRKNILFRKISASQPVDKATSEEYTALFAFSDKLDEELGRRVREISADLAKRQRSWP